MTFSHLTSVVMLQTDLDIISSKLTKDLATLCWDKGLHEIKDLSTFILYVTGCLKVNCINEREKAVGD